MPVAKSVSEEGRRVRMWRSSMREGQPVVEVRKRSARKTTHHVRRRDSVSKGLRGGGSGDGRGSLSSW